MRDIASLPSGIEHQFLPPLDPPRRGDRVLIWKNGHATEALAASVQGSTVLFVFEGRSYMVPADRVTSLIGRASV